MQLHASHLHTGQVGQNIIKPPWQLHQSIHGCLILFARFDKTRIQQHNQRNRASPTMSQNHPQPYTHNYESNTRSHYNRSASPSSDYIERPNDSEGDYIDQPSPPARSYRIPGSYSHFHPDVKRRHRPRDPPQDSEYISQPAGLRDDHIAPSTSHRRYSPTQPSAKDRTWDRKSSIPGAYASSSESHSDSEHGSDFETRSKSRSRRGSDIVSHRGRSHSKTASVRQLGSDIVSCRGRSSSRSRGLKNEEGSISSKEGSDYASVDGERRGGGSDVCSERGCAGGAGEWDDYIERDDDDRIGGGEDDEE
jgi:hypothetical protein